MKREIEAASGDVRGDNSAAEFSGTIDLTPLNGVQGKGENIPRP